MPQVKVNITQTGEITSQAIIRSHSVTIDRPEAKGGTDKGPMGGELLLAGLGGCFMSNLLAAISARDVVASNIQVEVEGTLEDASPRFSSMSLTVTGDYSDLDEIKRLAVISEKACISANTLKGSVQISVVVQ
jgi:putative redox protein